MNTGVPQYRMQAFAINGSQIGVWSDIRFMQGVVPAWFDPEHWGGQAATITTGGRGSAWVLDGSFGRAVLRHFRRGGFAAKFSADRFIWRGEHHVRSLQEFKMLQGMLALKLPVPIPLAAAYWRDGLFYRAAILLRFIESKSDFLAAVHSNPYYAPWELLGQTLAQFHKHRCHHADLNANNILLGKDDRLYLIDWDKAQIEPQLGGWVNTVIARLERSLLKYRGPVNPDSIRDGIARLKRAHEQTLRS